MSKVNLRVNYDAFKYLKIILYKVLERRLSESLCFAFEETHFKIFQLETKSSKFLAQLIKI